MKPLDNATHKIKLQLFLSHNGVCSRRKAFDLIKQGHVKVNGETVDEPSTMIDPGIDRIFIGSQQVAAKGFEYLMLHKPAGYVTTAEDRFAEKTVFDLLPREYRHLASVGRLDKDTEGLLLFTNDGDVAYKLTHPKFNIHKTYFVRIVGRLEQSGKERIEKGVMIDGEKTAPARIEKVVYKENVTELLLTIHEGKKRQIRLMFPKVGHKVLYLKRIAQGPISLGNLQRGQFRPLTNTEVEELKNDHA
ncbi:MAG: rRNA pseudouridine synthase [Candidatus Omnitrophica bacterium]|nr:rRNA pseudouridine synthase [Candidatus Omnitrophota bacterium]